VHGLAPGVVLGGIDNDCQICFVSNQERYRVTSNQRTSRN
jgi:hypothetical protein